MTIKSIYILADQDPFCFVQTYQNILNIETSTIRQQVVIPVDSLESVYQFKTNQEKTLEDVRRKLGLDTLMSKLQNIYPDLSEEEKCGSETKINEVKTLSNRIVQLLLQRMEIATDWAKILEVYRTTREQDGDRNRILSALNQIVHIQKENVQPLLDEVRKNCFFSLCKWQLTPKYAFIFAPFYRFINRIWISRPS